MNTATKPTPAPTDAELRQAINTAWHEGRKEGRREILGAIADVEASFERAGTIAESLIAMERAQRELLGFAERDCQAAERNAKEANDRVDRHAAEWQDADEVATGWRRPLRALINPERQRALDAGAELRERESCAQREGRRVTDLSQELALVREAVDAEIGAAHPLRPLVDAHRRAPVMPAGLQTFDAVEAFVADDGRRKMPHDDGGELEGYGPYGGSWLLEHDEKPWVISEHAIFWHPETHEVYARTTDNRTAAAIWVLGTATGDKQLTETLDRLSRSRMNERNSLVWATEQIRLAAQEA